MKIFWSWQSDTDGRTGRHFVRQALDLAAAKLASHPDLEAAERPPEVDSDTSNVPGSPAIAATILAKIRECAVFVADVTPVAQTRGGKKVPNPNVMFELGYALAQVENERIVLVMNRREGASLSGLPFDLRHWRAPLTYALTKGAQDDALAAELQTLSEDLIQRLGASLAYVLEQADAAGVRERPIISADPDDPAVWAGAAPTINATASGMEFSLPVVAGPKMYCRVVPAERFEATRADMAKVHDNRLAIMPLGRYSDLWSGVNGAGALAWSQARDRSLLSATQWFQETGEVWGVWPDALILHNDLLTFTPDAGAAALERFLENHFATFERLGARKPWRVEVGAHGLAGTFLPGNYRGGFKGLADQVVHRQDRVRGVAAEIREIAYAFTRKIYDAYGAPNLVREAYETMIHGH